MKNWNDLIERKQKMGGNILLFKCKKRELNYNWYLHLCSEEHKA